MGGGGNWRCVFVVLVVVLVRVPVSRLGHN